MDRRIDKLIASLERMFAYMNNTPLKSFEWSEVRICEIEFRTFLDDYRNPEKWISQDGKVNDISELSDTHLDNIIALMERHHPNCDGLQSYERTRFSELRAERIRREDRRAKECSGGPFGCDGKILVSAKEPPKCGTCGLLV